MRKLLHFNCEGRGLDVALAIVGCERVRRGFLWRDLHAAVARGPHVRVGWVELHGFCVRDAVTHVHCIASMDPAGRSVEADDFEFAAAESVVCLLRFVALWRAHRFSIFRVSSRPDTFRQRNSRAHMVRQLPRIPRQASFVAPAGRR